MKRTRTLVLSSLVFSGPVVMTEQFHRQGEPIKDVPAGQPVLTRRQ